MQAARAFEKSPIEAAAPPPLTPVQTSVLCDILRGRTLTEAARNAGIHRSSIHRWMMQDSFRLTLENAQRESYLAAFFEIHTLMRPATKCLLEALESPKTSAMAALRIHQYLQTLFVKAQPPAIVTNAETQAIIDNLLDGTTPEIDRHATKCDTPAPVAGTSPTTPNATECDTPAPVGETSHAAPQIAATQPPKAKSQPAEALLSSGCAIPPPARVIDHLPASEAPARHPEMTVKRRIILAMERFGLVLQSLPRPEIRKASKNLRHECTRAF